MVLENVIFFVRVDSPVRWCSTPNYWSVIIFYRGECIGEITEADTTVTVSVVAIEEKFNMITGNNKPDVAKSISEFIKTQIAAFSSVKHSEGITNVEVRFDNDVVSWVFYVALDLDCFCQEIKYLGYWLSLKCSTKSFVFALMRLIHVLEWFGVNVLLADLLERLRVHRYATVFCRRQALAWLLFFSKFNVFKIGAHDFCPVFRISLCCR